MTNLRILVKKLRLLNNQGLSKPTLDVPTRWNATYHMLQCLMKPGIRQFCENFAAANKYFKVAESTWRRIYEVVNTLVPAELAKKKLQSEQMTLGDLYGTWMKCKLELKAMNTALAKKLYANMCKREVKLLANNALKCAIYLDPKYHVTLSATEKSEAVDMLTNLYYRMQNLQKGTDRMSMVEVEMAEEAASTETDDELERLLRGLEQNQAREPSLVRTNGGVDIKPLLQDFFNTKRLPSTVNVLEYWHGEQFNQPHLYQLE